MSKTKYKLRDLIDIEQFQGLQDRLNAIYSFPSSIIDNEGKILTATAWQDICTKFHRQNKECEKECIKSDQYIIDHLHEANPAVSYRCPHGLIDNATPIVIDGEHLGNFFTGQFFLEEPDLDFFRRQAEKYGFDEEAYLEAVRKVPVWTMEQVNSYLFFIKGLIEVISCTGLKNLREIESGKRIKESYERQKSILRTAMDGFWITDTKGRLLEVNDTYCGMSGYSEKELLAMHISDLEAVEDKSEIKKHMQLLIERGQDRFISTHRRKDGSLFDVEISMQSRDIDGGQCVVFIRDITERRQAEEKLKSSEERYRSILQTTRDGYLLVDQNGCLQDVNDSYCRMTGFAREEILSMTVADVEAIEKPEEIKARIMLLKEKGSVLFETNHRRKNGEVFDVEVSITLVPDAGGMVVSLIRDISERKRSEKLLEQERARLKNVLDGTQAGTWKWNVQTGETIYNNRWAEMIGYTLDELSPVSIETLKKLTHPEDLLMATELVEKHFKGEPEYYECRLRMRHKNGAWVWVQDKGRVAEWSDDGKPLWMYGTHQDITSQVKAEEGLKKSELQLSGALQMAKAGHWEYDVESDKFTFNDNFYRIFRTSADEVGGYTMSAAEYALRFLHPEDAHMVAEENRMALETDDPSFNHTIEHRIKYSDGETGHIIVRYFIEKDGAGKTIRTFGVNQDITERKLMEQAVAERERIFRRVFNESPVGKELYNSDGILVELNNSCLEMFGVSDPEQVKGFNLFEDPNIPDTAKESLRKGQAVSYDCDFNLAEVNRLKLYDTSKTGKLLIHADITPLGWDGRRAAGGYLVQVMDITEHRHLEQEREATLNILRLLNAPNNRQELMKSVILYLRNWTGCEAVGIRIKEGEDFPYYVTEGFSNEFVLAEKFLCERDRHGRIVRDSQLNAVLDCMCGNIIRGRFDPKLPFFTGHGSFWTNSTTELLSSTSEKDRQSRTRNRCHGEGYESVALVPIRFGQETFGLLQINDRRKNVFTQRMINILERLADNLAIGMAQRASVARLRDSKERLSLATRAAGIGIWDWDVVGNELKWDDEMYRLYGIGQNDFTGAYEAWFSCLHPDDKKNVETEIQAALQGLREYAPEFRIIRPDGSIRHIQAASQTFRDSDGKPQRMIGTNIDVTDRRQLEIEREKASKLESIGLLAGGIAHDFNNLLMAILGNVALCKLNASIKGADDLVDSMVEAENALKRAKELTRQLLTFAKGGAPIKKAVHMPKLIDEALRFAATGSKVKCSSKYKENLWPCDIDEGQISQVLHNLVINAVQAMPEGGRIEALAENFEVQSKSGRPLNEGRYVKITISDQGHGIPKEHLKKIFDPYFTTKQKGSGLGLATSYSIVNRHDGHLEVESEIGKGSSFTIFLPASKKEIEETKVIAADVSEINSNILVMDDEPDVLNVLSKMLKTIGCKCETAEDGAEAVRKYRKAMKSGRPFDAVILDLTVPGGMGGKETVQKLLDLDPGAKVIVSSGYSDDLVMSNYQDYGFRAEIAKPYEIANLQKTLIGAIKY